MKELTEKEFELLEVIWANEPFYSRDLVEICRREFDRKKSTTYTMLRNLVKKGVVKNEDSRVESLYTREEYFSKLGQAFVADKFQGSLPLFVNSFVKSKGLSEDEIDEIQEIIDEMREES